MLVRLISSVSRHGRRCAQSIPVDGLRCTLSIRTDHSTIGTPQASTLAIAEFGPLIGPRDPQSMPRKAAISGAKRAMRSEEHTSELQSLMRISYAVFCLKKKN